MRKAFIVISAPQMYGFVQGHAQRLRSSGYKTVVVSAHSEALKSQAVADGARVAAVPMVREISPFWDLRAFAALCLLIIRERPDAIISMGPKANLLGNLAGWLADVPYRISLYVGIRQETMTGLSAQIVDFCDRIALRVSTYILAISESLKAAMAKRGLAPATRIYVTGNGTTNGITADNFPFDQASFGSALSIRNMLNLPPHVPVVGFVGRITEDKGLIDIFNTYYSVRQSKPDTHLLLVGQDEVKTSKGRLALEALSKDPQVRLVGAVADVRPYIHLFWIHLFPSHREGFGNATLEAAALAIPTVGYKVTGVLDAVSHNSTGVLVLKDDIAALAMSTLEYFNFPERRMLHGLSARQRALELYHPDITWASFLPGLELPTYTYSHRPEVKPINQEYVQREEILLKSKLNNF